MISQKQIDEIKGQAAFDKKFDKKFGKKGVSFASYCLELLEENQRLSTPIELSPGDEAAAEKWAFAEYGLNEYEVTGTKGFKGFLAGCAKVRAELDSEMERLREALWAVASVGGRVQLSNVDKIATAHRIAMEAVENLLSQCAKGKK